MSFAGFKTMGPNCCCCRSNFYQNNGTGLIELELNPDAAVNNRLSLRAQLTGGFAYPGGTAVDYLNEHVYFRRTVGTSGIYRVDKHFQQTPTLILATTAAEHLAVNPAAEEIYYNTIDSINGDKIRRVNYDGSGDSQIYDAGTYAGNANRIQWITYAKVNNKLYFEQIETNTIDLNAAAHVMQSDTDGSGATAVVSTTTPRAAIASTKRLNSPKINNVTQKLYVLRHDNTVTVDYTLESYNLDGSGREVLDTLANTPTINNFANLAVSNKSNKVLVFWRYNGVVWTWSEYDVTASGPLTDVATEGDFNAIPGVDSMNTSSRQMSYGCGYEDFGANTLA